MKRGIFAEAGASVFRDESVLYPEFLPEVLPHRENQIHAIADCLKPLLKKSRPTPVFLHGPPGVGKTAVARFILRELKEEGVNGVYVNCWQHDSRHAILTQVTYSLGSFAPRRGTSTDEIYAKFLEGLKKNSPVVLVLDELDRMLANEGSSVLYDILRNGEQLGLILISNDSYALRQLDDRTRSSLSCEDAGFSAYTPKEMEDVLKERVEVAFVPRTVGPGVLSALAHFACANGSDVRIGLETLLRAGRLAENSGKGKLTMIEVNKVISQHSGVRFKEKIKSLDAPKKQLLEEVAKVPGLLSGELLTKLNATAPLAPRTLRKYVAELERLGLVKAQLTGKGQKGKSRTLSLTFDPKLLNEPEK